MCLQAGVALATLARVRREAPLDLWITRVMDRNSEALRNSHRPGLSGPSKAEAWAN